jgi:hypothetical protein
MTREARGTNLKSVLMSIDEPNRQSSRVARPARACRSSAPGFFRACHTCRVPIALIALLALGILIRVGHWHPGTGADDTRYMNYAAMLARGERMPPFQYDTAAVRLAYEIALAAPMWLFGATTTVCSLTSLAVFAATAVLLFQLTGRLAGTAAALTAVFLYDLLPLDITLSTQVLPDPLMTALVLAAGLLYFRLADATDRQARRGWALATGVVLGLAVSVKEPACWAGPVFAIHLANRRPGLRAWLAALGMMVLGGLLVLGVEVALFWLWTGDPLYRFRAVAEGMKRIEPSQTLSAFSLREAAFYLIAASNARDAFGIHFYLVTVAVLLGLNRRNRALEFPLVWCLVFGLFLSVGSLSLRQYIMPPHRPRYFLPVAVMGCSIAAMELVEVCRRLEIQRWVVAAGAVLLAALSFRAALVDEPSGMVPTAETLARLDWGQDSNNRESSIEPEKTLLLKSFVERQALERRRGLEGFAVVDDRMVERWHPEFTELLKRRRLVVPVFQGYEGPGELGASLEIAATRHMVERKQLYGPAWPPYLRWLGIGRRSRVIAHLWGPYLGGPRL